MEIRRNPKVIAAVLVTGTIALIVGGALTASWPSSHSPKAVPVGNSASSPQSSGPAPTSSQPPSASGGMDADSTTQPVPVATSTEAPPVPAAAQSFTYTVMPGDTLFDIAQWFKLHGYGDLYAANAGVIGANPSLIRPGERITVTGGVWTMQPPA